MSNTGVAIGLSDDTRTKLTVSDVLKAKINTLSALMQAALDAGTFGIDRGSF